MGSGSGGPAGTEDCGTRAPGPDCMVRDWTVAAVWHSLKIEKVRLALVHNTPASFSPTSPKFRVGGAITRQVDSRVPVSGTTCLGSLGWETEKAPSAVKAWPCAVGEKSRVTVRLDGACAVPGGAGIVILLVTMSGLMLSVRMWKEAVASSLTCSPCTKQTSVPTFWISKESMFEVSPTCTLPKLSCEGATTNWQGGTSRPWPVSGIWMVLPWPPLLFTNKAPLSLELPVGA